MSARASIPTWPLLKPWYRLAETGEGLLLEHGQAVVRFGGAAAVRLLPALLPLLDGTRTTDDLIAVVGRPVEPAILNALELLAEHDLLLEGPEALDPADTRRATIEPLLAEASSVGLKELLRRLESARVALLGSEPLAEQLARQFRLSGIGHIGSEPAESADLVVVAEGADGTRHALDWNRSRLGVELPWLPVGDYDGSVSTVGPLVVPGETACFECLLIRRASTSGCAPEHASLRAIPRRARPSLVQTSLSAAIAARIVVRWVCLRDPALPGAVVTIPTRGELTVETHHVLRVPRCPACSATAVAAAPSPWFEAHARVG